MNKKAYTQPRVKVTPMVRRTMLCSSQHTVRSLSNSDENFKLEELDEDDR